MTQELEARLQVIEDTEAIKNLRATYCYLVDAGVAGDASKLDELVELFTDDARTEYGDYAKMVIVRKESGISRLPVHLLQLTGQHGRRGNILRNM